MMTEKTWNQIQDELINRIIANAQPARPAMPTHLMTAEEVYAELRNPKPVIEHETVIRRITK